MPRPPQPEGECLRRAPRSSGLCRTGSTSACRRSARRSPPRGSGRSSPRALPCPGLGPRRGVRRAVLEKKPSPLASAGSCAWVRARSGPGRWLGGASPRRGVRRHVAGHDPCQVAPRAPTSGGPGGSGVIGPSCVSPASGVVSPRLAGRLGRGGTAFRASRACGRARPYRPRRRPRSADRGRCRRASRVPGPSSWDGTRVPWRTSHETGSPFPPRREDIRSRGRGTLRTLVPGFGSRCPLFWFNKNCAEIALAFG